MKTYQDYLAAENKSQFIYEAVTEYKSSDFYKKSVDAEAYFKGENTGILTRSISITTGANHQINLHRAQVPTNYFRRLVIQQAGTLLNFGLETKDSGVKDKLGEGFDTTLARAGEKALIHGVGYLYWDFDRVRSFTALECFTLQDERTGAERAAIRFWQIDDKKPLFIEFYEHDGVTSYKAQDGVIAEERAKTAYRVRVRAITEDSEAANLYYTLPIVPLRADEYERSELTTSLKAKIDMYDMILSDFSDIVERAKGIIWIFNGFSGTVAELNAIREDVERLGVIAYDDPETKIQPHAIEIPHEAVTAALSMLKRAIFEDFTGMNMDEITGGSLTNVAIRTAQDALMKKVGRWERQQVIEACRRVMALAGVQTENIKFRYDVVANDLENAQILQMFTSYLDLETILQKIPIIDPDEVEDVLKRKAAEDLSLPDDGGDDGEPAHGGKAV